MDSMGWLTAQMDFLAPMRSAFLEFVTRSLQITDRAVNELLQK